MAAFGGHLFYDLFVQGWGGEAMAPSATPLNSLLENGFAFNEKGQVLNKIKIW